MGGGAWTTNAYTRTLNSMGFDSKEDILYSNVQKVFKNRFLAKELNPKNVLRECRDTEEHPNTIPVILALDVTGSMGSAAKTCAAKLDDIITTLYRDVRDVEFLMMGIGDLAYDDAPIQASQFESDVRILDQTSKIYFEGGGGSNLFESYTAVWYFGLHSTDLDCWKRGKKGIIITMGDEPLNPYLPYKELNKVMGSSEQGDVETASLYLKAKEKYDIFHISITDRETNFIWHEDEARSSWKRFLGQNYIEGSNKDLAKIIGDIVKKCTSVGEPIAISSEGISW